VDDCGVGSFIAPRNRIVYLLLRGQNDPGITLDRVYQVLFPRKESDQELKVITHSANSEAKKAPLYIVISRTSVSRDELSKCAL